MRGIEMTYKGYKANIIFDSEANTFYGEILNSSAVIHFRGNSVEELEKSFQEGIDEYLIICEEEGIIPERPFSGEFRVRITPELHKKIFLQAKKEKLSINKFAIKAFEEKLENNEDKLLSTTDVAGVSFYKNLIQDLRVGISSTTNTDFDTEVNTGILVNDSTNNIIDFPAAV